MTETTNYWGIVPAAGVGKRMQADRPKQYLPLNGGTVIEQTLTRLLQVEVFSAVVVAISAEDPFGQNLIFLKTNVSILLQGVRSGQIRYYRLYKQLLIKQNRMIGCWCMMRRALVLLKVM